MKTLTYLCLATSTLFNACCKSEQVKPEVKIVYVDRNITVPAKVHLINLPQPRELNITVSDKGCTSEENWIKLHSLINQLRNLAGFYEQQNNLVNDSSGEKF